MCLTNARAKKVATTMSQMTSFVSAERPCWNVSVRVVTAKVREERPRAHGEGERTSPVTLDAQMANSDHFWCARPRSWDGDEVAHAESMDTATISRAVHVRRGRGRQRRCSPGRSTMKPDDARVLVVATRRAEEERARGRQVADARRIGGQPGARARRVQSRESATTNPTSRSPRRAPRDANLLQMARPARYGRDAPSPRRDASTRTRRRGRAAARGHAAGADIVGGVRVVASALTNFSMKGVTRGAPRA